MIWVFFVRGAAHGVRERGGGGCVQSVSWVGLLEGNEWRLVCGRRAHGRMWTLPRALVVVTCTPAGLAPGVQVHGSSPVHVRCLSPVQVLAGRG